MEYEHATGADEPAQSDESEPKLQAPLESFAVQPSSELPKWVRPEQQRRIPKRKKEMAASAPGSDYWLGQVAG